MAKKQFIRTEDPQYSMYDYMPTGNPLATVETGKAMQSVSFIDLEPYSDYVDFSKANPIYSHINDIRATNQTSLERLGRAAHQSGVIAIATMADFMLGNTAGLINVFSGGKDGKSEFNDFINNPVSLFLEEWKAKHEKENQLFETATQEQKEWYDKLGTTKFWGDTIIKNSGFAIGAVAAMAVSGSAFAYLAGLNSLSKQSKLLNSILKLQKAGKSDEVLKIVENGRLAKLSQEAIEKEIADVAKKIGRRTAIVENSSAFVSSIGEARAEAISNGADFRESEMNKLISEFGGEGNIPQYLLQELDEKQKYYENTVFGLNLPILTFSQLSQFRNIYTGSIKAQRQVMTEAVKDTGKELTFKRNLFRKALPYVKNPLTEMTEEQMQFAVSYGTKDYYARVNEGRASGLPNEFAAAFAGLSEAYGSAEGWENAVAGLVMGGTGVPVVRGFKDSKGKFRSPVYLAGGIASDVKDANADAKLTKSLVERANQYGFDSNLRKLYDLNLRNVSYEKDKETAIQEDNDVALKTLSKQQFVDMVSVYSQLGLIEKLNSQIEDESNLTADELRTKYSIDVKQADGTVKKVDPFSQLSDEELMKTISAKSESAKKDIEKIVELRQNIRNRFTQASDTSVDYLTNLAFSNADIDNRIDKLSQKLKSFTLPKQNKVGDGEFLDQEQLLYFDYQDRIDFTNPDQVETFLNKAKDLVAKNPALIGLEKDAIDFVTLNKLKEKFNQEYLKMFNPEYILEMENKIKEDFEEEQKKAKAGQTQFEFYDENTIDDEQGFESGEIYFPDGGGKTLKLQQGDFENLYDDAGNPFMKINDFLKNSKSAERVLENPFEQSPKSEKITYLENFLKAGNNAIYFKVTPQEVRSKRLNAEQKRKYDIRIKSLEILVEKQKQMLLGFYESSEYKKAKELVVKLEQELSQLLKEVDAIAQKASENKGIVKTNLNKKAEKLFESAIELENKLIEARKTAVKEKETLSEHAASLKADYNQLKKQLDITKKAKEETLNQIIDRQPLTKDINNLEANLKQAQDNINKQIEELQKLEPELESELNQLQAELGITEIVVEEIEKEVSKLSYAISAVRDTLKSFFDGVVKKLESISNFPNLQSILDKFSRNAVFSSLEDALSPQDKDVMLKALDEIMVFEETAFQDLVRMEKLKRVLEILKEQEKLKADKIRLLGNNLPELQLQEYKKQLDILERAELEGEKTISFTNQKDNPQTTGTWEESKKQDISKTGFATSAGRDASTKHDFLTEEDRKAAANTANENIEENRWYRFLENVLLNPNDANYGKHRIMTVTINDSVYGLGKPDSVYTEVEIPGVTHTEDDIRFIVVDKEGKPVKYLGKNVVGRIKTDSSTFTNQETRFSTSYTSMTLEEQIEAAAEVHKEFRDSIKQNPTENKFLTIDYSLSSRGLIVHNRDAEGKIIKSPIIGTLVSEEQLNNISLAVVTQDQVQVGTTSYKYPKGRIVIKHKNNLIPAITRNVDYNDASTIYYLLQRLYSNVVNKVENPNSLGKEFDFSITTYIKNLVFLSKNINDSNVDLILKQESLILGELLLKPEDILDPANKFMILEALQNKVRQVNKSMLNSKRKFNTVTYNAETGKFELQEYKNYNEFLIKGDNPVVTTSVKPEVKPENEQDLINPETAPAYRRFQNGYVKYNYGNNVSKEVGLELGEAVFEDEANIQPPVAEELQEIKPVVPKKSIAAKLPTTPTSPVVPNNLDGLKVKEVLKALNTLQKDIKDPNVLKLIEAEKDKLRPIVVAGQGGSLHNLSPKLKEALQSNALSTSVAKTEKPVVTPTVTPPTEEVVTKNESVDSILKNLPNFDGNFRLATNNENKKQIDIDIARKNLAKILNVPVYVITGRLIKGIADGQLTKYGDILLSSLAEEGTEYHEAYHYVSLFLISPEERNLLYANYRKRVGNQELTNREVEEALAESFRNYAANNQLDIPKETKNVFQRIIDFFKNLSYLIFKKNNTNNKDIIEDMFNSILQGDYKGKSPLIKELKEDSYQSSRNNIARVFHSFFVEKISELPKNLFTLQDETDLEQAYEQMFEILPFKDTLFQDVKNLNPDITTDKQAQEYLTNLHLQYLTQLGLDSEFKEDETVGEIGDLDAVFSKEIENNERGDSDNHKESYLSSPTANIYKPIKLLISGLSTTENGVRQAYEYSFIVNKVANLLGGSTSFDEMLARLNNSGFPAFVELAGKLSPINNSMDLYDVRLRLSFFNTFYKNKNTFIKGIFNTKDDNAGSIGISDANTNKLQHRIKKDWEVNILSGLASNQIGIRNGYPVLSNNLLNAVINTPKKAHDFLGYLGLNLIPLKEIQSSEDVYSTVISFIESLKREQRANKHIGNIFNNKTNDKGNIDKFFELTTEFEEDAVELQVSLATGETAYSLSNNSFFSRVINQLNTGILPSFLEGEYSKDSIALKLAKEGVKIKPQILSGISDSLFSGTSSDELNYKSYISMLFVSTLNNIYPTVPTSDKSSVRAYTLEKGGRKLAYISVDQNVSTNELINEAVNQLYGYYLTERSLKPQRSKVKVKNTDKFGKEGIFSNIVSKNYKDATEQSAKEQIAEFVNKTITENINLFYNSGLLETENGVLTKNDLNKLLGKPRIDTAEDIDKLVTGFTVNNMLSMIEQSKFIYGNPVLYKDYLDLFKRTAGVVAETTPVMNDPNLTSWLNNKYPRLDGKARNGKARILVVQDVKTTLEELKSLGYGNTEEADAFALIMEDFYRDIHFYSDRWSEKDNDAWIKETQGKFTNHQLPAASKLVAYGTQSEEDFLPFYLKMATFRTGKSLMETIKNQKGEYPQLNKLINELKNKQIDIVVFNSGNKVGTKLDSKGAHPFYKEDGTIADVNEDFVSEISISDIGIQVENKASDSFNVTRGTQPAALEVSNLFENGNPINKTVNIDGKEITVKEAVNELFNLQNDLTETLKEEFKAELGLENVDNRWVIKNVNKLKDALVKASVNRTLPQNIINGIVLQLNHLKKSGSAFLDTIPNHEKIEYMISALFANKVITQSRNGISAVQFPSTGLETKPRVKNGKNWKESDELKFYSKNGKRVMQVYLPDIYKGRVPNKLDLLKEAKLNQAYGFRIPTEQLNSIDVIEIVGFLPANYGKVVIVPTGITTKVGSDFDFDKLNMYLPNYTITYKKLNLEQVKEFKETEFFNNLPDDIKSVIQDMSEEEFNARIKHLNKFSVTSGQGELGNLASSEEFKNLTKEEQYFYKVFKEALVDFNQYKRDLTTQNKELEESFNGIEYNYISYNEENLSNPNLRKQAIENRMLTLSRELVGAEFRAEEHLMPNSISDIFGDSDSIYDNIISGFQKAGLPYDNTKFNWSDLLKFKTVTENQNKFWYGKKLVGAAALANKNHILSQLSGFGIASRIPNNFDIDPKTNKPKFVDVSMSPFGIQPNNGKVELGRIKDTKGNLISKVLGQAVSLFVDVAKNPQVLPVLNLNDITVNTAAYMLRAGVPKDTVFYFISQPAIKDFVKEMQNRKELVNTHNLSYQEVVEKLFAHYPIGAAVSFSNENLLSYKNENQGYILKKFLDYKIAADLVGNFQSAVSFDTKTFKNKNELSKAIASFDGIMKNPYLINKDKYVANFIKGFQQASFESENYFDSLTIYGNLPTSITSKVEAIKAKLYERLVPNKEMSRALDIVQNDFITYLMYKALPKYASKGDRVISLSTEYDTLVFGNNTVAHRFEAFKKKHGNKFKELRHLIVETKDNRSYLRIFNKKLNSYQIDDIVNTVVDISKLDPDLAVDMYKLAIIQSSFNLGRYDIRNAMPSVNTFNNKSFSNLIVHFLNSLSADVINVKEFETLLFMNNVDNNVLVPNSHYKVKVGEYYKFFDRPTQEYQLRLKTGVKKTDYTVVPNRKTDIKDYREIKANDIKQSTKSEISNIKVDLNQIKDNAFKQIISTYRTLSEDRKDAIKKKLKLENELDLQKYILKTVNEFQRVNLDMEQAIQQVKTELNKCL
jgi:hypothetical protein